MAKRRRLSVPFISTSQPGPDSGPDSGSGPSSAGAIPLRRPPIAEVAGEAAATSALAEMAARFENARAEGRMIQSLPLDAIETDYLMRDRLGLEAEAQEALVASIRARGQQMPIEVVELEAGQRYGLISGWRRLAALRALQAETGADRFATALAILRRPADAPEAYLAMVEENEIRAGLSYYERARIAARAVEAGVFGSDTAALQTLFAAASRPRRSKIGSFLRIVRELDGALRFPAAIPERLGLELSAALQADADLGPRIAAALHETRPETAEAERALILRLVAQARAEKTEDGAGDAAQPGARPTRVTPSDGTPAESAAPETTPIVTYEPERGRITLTGSGIDAALARRLRAWLAEGQG